MLEKHLRETSLGEGWDAQREGMIQEGHAHHG